MDHYTIEVVNSSGSQTGYYFFTQTPAMSNDTTTLFTNAFAVAETPNTFSSTAKMSKKWYAVVGSSSGSLSAGVTVATGGHVPVTLGDSSQGGTTLPFVVIEGAPQFGGETSWSTPEAGAFSIQTGTDFTPLDAKDGSWIVGVGTASGGDDTAGACTTFRPDPATTYAISPKPIYYVAVGEVTVGAVIDTKQIGPSCMIDFTSGQFDQARVIHTDGKLTLETTFGSSKSGYKS